MYAFLLGVFSIRNFNLRNLKGNGNVPIVSDWRQCLHMSIDWSSLKISFLKLFENKKHLWDKFM